MKKNIKTLVVSFSVINILLGLDAVFVGGTLVSNIVDELF